MKPALADENTAEGLESFTEYWFELFSYGYETNNWAPFDAITGPDCRTCNQIKGIVEEIYGDGRWISGGEFEVRDFTTDFRENTSGSVQALVDNGQTEIIYFDIDGSEFPREPPSAPAVDVIFALYDAGAWRMLDYGLPEGS